MSFPDASVRVGGGRALERTVLAWNRSALAIVATAGLLIKVAADQGSLATGLLVGGVLGALALAVWLYGRATYRRADSGRSGVFAPNAAAVGLTAVSTTTGVLAAAIVLAG